MPSCLVSPADHGLHAAYHAPMTATSRWPHNVHHRSMSRLGCSRTTRFVTVCRVYGWFEDMCSWRMKTYMCKEEENEKTRGKTRRKPPSPCESPGGPKPVGEDATVQIQRDVDPDCVTLAQESLLETFRTALHAGPVPGNGVSVRSHLTPPTTTRLDVHANRVQGADVAL